MHLIDRVAGRGVAQDVLAGDRIVAGDIFDHPLARAPSLLQGALKQPGQRVGLVRQVAQDVHPPAGVRVEGGDLHPRDDGEAVAPAQNLGAGHTGHGVVVGDGQSVQTGALGVKDDVVQAGGAVGKFAVAM